MGSDRLEARREVHDSSPARACDCALLVKTHGVRRGIVYLKQIGFFVFYPIPTQLEVHGMRERALVSRVSTLRYKLISAFTLIYSDDSCLSHA